MGDLLENHILPSPLPSSSEKCLLCHSHSCLSPFRIHFSFFLFLVYCEQCTNTVFTHPSISFPFKFCLQCHTFHYYLYLLFYSLHLFSFFQRIEEASPMKLSSSCVEGHRSLPSGRISSSSYSSTSSSFFPSPPLLFIFTVITVSPSLSLSIFSFSMIKPSSIQLPSQETPTHCSLCHTPSTTCIDSFFSLWLAICQVCQLGYIFQLSDSLIKYCTHCHTFHLLEYPPSSSLLVLVPSILLQFTTISLIVCSPLPTILPTFILISRIIVFLPSETFIPLDSTLSEETLHSFVEKQQLEAYFYILFLDLYQEKNTQFPKNLNDQIHHRIFSLSFSSLEPEHCSVCQVSIPSSSCMNAPFSVISSPL